jgi:oligopeptide/dipeptide ABC transporter ATP-binding protein
MTSASQELLSVESLTVGFARRDGIALVVNDVSFEIEPGRVLGLVGESGCGKSVTLRALMGMVPAPGRMLGGVISWRGTRLEVGNQRSWERLRGSEISLVFQDPAAVLDPVFTVGAQLTEVLRTKLNLGKRGARERAVELLDRVGIASARSRLDSYPHQLSGGMRQRVMIALAIAPGPKLLLADEPTTALDVTIQDQILRLLVKLQAEEDMAMIIVSHDLGVIAQTCDEVAVMYAGRVVEWGLRKDVIDHPRHPYTIGLMRASPTLEDIDARIQAIPGQPPDALELKDGCPFRPRCTHARAECAEIEMRLDQSLPAHASACPFELTST